MSNHTTEYNRPKSVQICAEKAFGGGYIGLRESMYFIIFVYYAKNGIPLKKRNYIVS